MSKTNFHAVWNSMLQRCNNPNTNEYNSYGGRGIKVSGEWHDFNNFKNDMYLAYLKHCEKFGANNTTIDRIDVNQGYNLENCRWATYEQQSYNRRNTRYAEIDGKKYTILELSKIYNVSKNLIQGRYTRGLRGMELIDGEKSTVGGKK